LGKYLDIARRMDREEVPRSGNSTTDRVVITHPKPPLDSIPEIATPFLVAEIVEMAMRSVPETTFLYRGSKDIAPMEFPLCPTCESRRYWLGTEGKVVCSRCGQVRFEIIAMEFKAIQ